MKLLFVGNHQGPGNATGEEPDERHMARCLDRCENDVRIVPRDEVHAFYTGAKTDNLPPAEKYDLILLGKWNHFTADMIRGLKERYQAPVVYWVWDFMRQFHKEAYPQGWWPDWHEMILKECDLYLSGELGLAPLFKEKGINFQYFNWDTSDGQFDQLPLSRPENYDVIFTGSYIPHSYRNGMLEVIRDKFSLTIFSHDYERWAEAGFTANPGLYGGSYNQLTNNAKVCVCMNWIDPRPETIGYWSNRIGKITTTGGLPIVHYVPGMERAFGDNVVYFYDQADMLNKIDWLLGHPEQRETLRVKAYQFGRQWMTTQVRMRQLTILLENYLKHL